MTQPISYLTPTQPLDFHNRKGMLLAFGILLIIFGAISGCVSAIIPIGLAMQPVAGRRGASVGPGPTMSLATLLSGMAIYVFAAVALIWIGIGAIRAQRWVRPIVLILGTLWIAMGAAGFVNVLLAAPIMRAAMASSPAARTAASGGLPTIVAVISSGFMLLLGVVLPAVMVWLFSSNDVTRTLEFYDPRHRWTEDCPLPVLGMSCTCALMAIGSLMGSAYPAIPVFGVIVGRGVAMPLFLVQSILLGAAAVLLYRVRPLGWWPGVAVALVITLSTAITLLRLDPVTIAQAMGQPAEQVELM